MPEAPYLVLAPHLSYPLRNGADILIAERWSAFSRFVHSVCIVGQSAVYQYENGVLTQSKAYPNRTRSKRSAAFRALATNGDYRRCKFMTGSFRNQAERHLADRGFGSVVFSFLFTAFDFDSQRSLLDGRRLLVETHNNDFLWYSNLRERAGSAVARRIAAGSLARVTEFLTGCASDYTLIHLTEADKEGYEREVGVHSHIVAPIGVRVIDGDGWHSERDLIRLLFVGSLDVQMNFSALNHFAQTYYPVMADRLNGRVDVVVAGSNPTQGVVRLCQMNGWTLEPNVSDERLRELYMDASFSVHPFEYSTGAKLKLLQTIAYGVPFLATSVLSGQLDDHLPRCLFSDSPTEWADHTLKALENEITVSDHDSLLDVARHHSWEESAAAVWRALNEMDVVAGAG